MNQNNQSRLEGVKDKLLTVKDWILDHRKIVMPAILIAVSYTHLDVYKRQRIYAASDCSNTKGEKKWKIIF